MPSLKRNMNKKEKWGTHEGPEENAPGILRPGNRHGNADDQGAPESECMDLPGLVDLIIDH